MTVPVYLIVAAVAGSACAQDYLQYRPEGHVAGVIRTWGHLDGRIVQAWQSGFGKLQPGVRFETSLKGNDSAIGGLYTGAADMALMDREVWPIEIDAFQQVFENKPLLLAVLNASRMPAFLNSDNPLSQITLAELDGVFGVDHRRSARTFRTWGELGLAGEWRDKPIHLYGYDIGSAPSFFLEETVLGGSRRWNSNLHEFAQGQEIVDAVASDRYGIGISGSEFRNGKARAIGVGLTRSVWLVVHRKPGHPLDPVTKEYIRYILSGEGQEAASKMGSYRPIDAETAAREIRSLE